MCKTAKTDNDLQQRERRLTSCTRSGSIGADKFARDLAKDSQLPPYEVPSLVISTVIRISQFRQP